MSSQKPKLLYFGTPELAVKPLRALVNTGKYQIIGVVTQPDKPVGRGNKLTPPPVKRAAMELGLKVFQPASIKKITTESGKLITSGAAAELAELLNENPDLAAGVVVAYGKIIPAALLDFPAAGIINIHLSLLPHLRGAAPIQRAVLLGDSESGITIMKLDEGLDTGPIFAMEKIDIARDDTSGTLGEKLIAVGTDLLLNTLPGIISGALEPKPQPAEGASIAEKVSKADFKIDWNMSAAKILLRIRAGAPNPGAAANFGGEPIKIFSAAAARDLNYSESTPGTIVELNKAELVVACGEKTFLEIKEIQFPGKKRLAIEEVLRGKTIERGKNFS